MAQPTDKPVQIADAGKLDALIHRLIDDIALSRSGVDAHMIEVERARAMLKDEQPRKHKPWESASELVYPYVKQAKFALLSHFCPTLLGPDPILHYEGANAKAKPMAEAMESFAQRQATEVVGFRKIMERVYDASLRDGTAIVYAYWRTEQREQPYFVQNAETGKIEKAVATRTVYDAPQIDLVPLDKFGTFPKANHDIQLSPGVFRMVSLTGDEVLQRMASGWFSEEAVAALRQHPHDNDANVTASDEARGIQEMVVDEAFRDATYELTEIYYRYIDREDSTKAAQDWVFVVHEPTHTVLRAEPNPWFHQQRPFVAISPYQDVEGFYGDSLSSAGAGHVQTGMTTLMRLAIDAAAIGIAPEMLVAASLGKNIADLKKRRGPGGVIPFPDAYFENNSTKMQPFGNNGFSPSIVMPLMELLDNNGQQSTGASDATKGVPNAGNVTATEAAQIMESSQKIIAFLAERLATGTAEVGKLLHALNYQFQGNEGPLALWDEVNGDKEEVTLFDAMQQKYLITSSGIRDTNNRAILAQRAMERLQILMAEPMVATDVSKRYTLLYDTLQANGTSDPERYLGTVKEWQQKEQMAAQAAAQQAQIDAAAQAGGVPAGADGAPAAEGGGEFPEEVLAYAEQYGMDAAEAAAKMELLEQLQGAGA